MEYAVEGRKNYRAELKFGIKTDTGDDSGTIIASSEVRVVTEAEIQETLQKFIGEQKQIPPMYSAIKKMVRSFISWHGRGLKLNGKHGALLLML